jgi:hypothetical protein
MFPDEEKVPVRKRWLEFKGEMTVIFHEHRASEVALVALGALQDIGKEDLWSLIQLVEDWKLRFAMMKAWIIYQEIAENEKIFPFLPVPSPDVKTPSPPVKVVSTVQQLTLWSEEDGAHT